MTDKTQPEVSNESLKAATWIIYQLDKIGRIKWPESVNIDDHSHHIAELRVILAKIIQERRP